MDFFQRIKNLQTRIKRKRGDGGLVEKDEPQVSFKGIPIKIKRRREVIVRRFMRACTMQPYSKWISLKAKGKETKRLKIAK